MNAQINMIEKDPETYTELTSELKTSDNEQENVINKELNMDEVMYEEKASTSKPPPGRKYTPPYVIGNRFTGIEERRKDTLWKKRRQNPVYYEHIVIEKEHIQNILDLDCKKDINKEIQSWMNEIG